MKYSVLSVLIVVLALLVFFKPFYGWQVRNFFEPKLGEKTGLDLRLENEALKAEIAKLRILKSQAFERTPGYSPAMVYSRYPFNFKNELLINTGKMSGVDTGKPVLFGGVFLGKIEKVFDETALVETIFDERFQLSAGVGNSGVKALFQGGLLPKLSLIPLAGSVESGDVVYSVSPDFPYGLPIGEIKDIHVSPDHLFREASVKLAYDVSEVNVVLVKK